MKTFSITEKQLDILAALSAKHQYTKDFLQQVEIIKAIQANPIEEASKTAVKENEASQ